MIRLPRLPQIQCDWWRLQVYWQQAMEAIEQAFAEVSLIISDAAASNATIAALTARVDNLNTDDVAEAANLYFTDARAQASLTGGTGIDYAAGTIAVDLPYLDARYIGKLAIRTVTADPVIADGDCTLLCDATAASIVANLPAASASVERVLTFKKIDGTANTVTLDANGAEAIDGSATIVISGVNDSYTIQSDGLAWWVI